mgnify:CR=1 FL=1
MDMGLFNQYIYTCIWYKLTSSLNISLDIQHYFKLIIAVCHLISTSRLAPTHLHIAVYNWACDIYKTEFADNFKLHYFINWADLYVNSQSKLMMCRRKPSATVCVSKCVSNCLSNRGNDIKEDWNISKLCCHYLVQRIKTRYTVLMLG